MQIGTAVDLSWYQSNEGRELISSLRQPFGLLEKPLALLINSYEVLEYKLLLYGKSCVGKSRFLSKLLNVHRINANYCETPGIQISTIYWPVKMIPAGTITIFKLNFWDVGDNSLLRHDYIVDVI
ncbi:hypothetical protein HELRODRAFT_159380 [Helobdella robusta]|uniref:REM2- and Rab-like small GTPase 1 n=1 Tax=Helobdella robusta TaxID=6412 RepID=T1ENZ3_HELRO|nr:hypothetical protein HELRODRAFT_159380 [Helobdella robusta]ESO12795.1 hypothetical protein HELRODRAFT_159380 [Helobdella robusta]